MQILHNMTNRIYCKSRHDVVDIFYFCHFYHFAIALSTTGRYNIGTTNELG